MAGLGRRTHYRKHLTDAVLHGLPEPNFELGDRIGKVVATRGSNQFDVYVAHPSRSDGPSGDDSTALRGPQLAILPTKFRKLVWVKRGDFVLVQAGDEGEDSENNTGIRYIITHILYKDQVKHLKDKKLWPADKEFADQAHHETEKDETCASDDDVREDPPVPKTAADNDDGIVYGADEDDDFLVNTNRIAALQIQDSEDESTDEEE